MTYRLALLSVFAACASNDIEPLQQTPDAAVDAAPTCPVVLITWRDAVAYWDDIRCTAMERCFPDRFAEWYGDQIGCRQQLGAQHCFGGRQTDWCDLPYPIERCLVLVDCRAASEVLACDVEAPVPEICNKAFY